MIAMQGIGMSVANRLQNEAMKNQAELQQAQFDHDLEMTQMVEGAEDMGGPKVCLDCYEEFEKM